MAMTVSELIEMLKDHDGDRVIVLANEYDGKDHHPASDVIECVYEDGEVKVSGPGQKAVVICP